MPNIKGAAKRMRQAEKARRRNKAVRAGLKDLRRSLLEKIAANATSEVGELHRRYCSALDKAAKKGVISKNSVNRRKSRLAVMIRAMAPPPAAAEPAAPAPDAPTAV